MGDTQIKLPSRLSWSAVSSYAECGQRYLLERGFKVSAPTWWSTIGGKAVHEITEAADRAELKGVAWDDQLSLAKDFEPVFERLIQEELDAGREIKPSGRVLKEFGFNGGPNKKDKDWWLHWGPIFIQQWMDWKRERLSGPNAWRIATMPDGQPGIELGFDVTISDLRVVGYIDRVYTMPDGSLVVLDLKMGATPPGHLQLVTYGLGLQETYGITADWGMFWGPGPEGPKVSPAVSLPGWPLPQVADMYGQAMRGIEAGVFLPKVSALCKGCVVNDYCWAVRGKKAAEIPAEFEMVDTITGVVSESAMCAKGDGKGSHGDI